MRVLVDFQKIGKTFIRMQIILVAQMKLIVHTGGQIFRTRAVRLVKVATH